LSTPQQAEPKDAKKKRPTRKGWHDFVLVQNYLLEGGWFLLLDGVMQLVDRIDKKKDELDGVLDSCDVEFGTPSNKYISLSDMTQHNFHVG